MKAGELQGLRSLAHDVADCILPRLIIPPSSERDEKVPLLLRLDKAPDIATSLASAWRQRPALIDASYIIDEFGRDSVADWLPLMLARARKREARVIPTVLLSDIALSGVDFLHAIAFDEILKFCIRVTSDETAGTQFPIMLKEALRSIRLDPGDCAIIVDFGNSEFDEPAIVAPIIRGALELLQELGRWQHIIFQGSHYPDKNPAPPGGFSYWPRNEWKAWQTAVKFDPTTAESMIFGDYAADCSRIEFGGSKGKAIRHMRYTAGENWRIQRGTKDGSDRASMHGVYSDLVRSADFAGASFSNADSYISSAAANPDLPQGNAVTWRQLNTTHHITQVVNDIASVRGVKLKRMPVKLQLQSSLLPLM